MFDKAQKVVVKGGTFVANVESSTSTFSNDVVQKALRSNDANAFTIVSQGLNLERLFDRAALNAILNAGGRADEVRCHPGTRERVIGKVERWMNGQSKPDHRMFWLSGPAGAGKSAIMQTVMERCKERGTLAASFFFFRGDGTRNDAQPLVATLVYQLLNFYPALRGHLQDSLTAKPLTYKASTEEQFIEFISSPFKIIRHSSSAHQPIILIIDGLDECNDEREQERILGSLHALVNEDDSPFRVLVASRAEHHLQMTFNKLQTSVESIFLDDNYEPEDDIRRFVVAKFKEIKQLHPLSQTLSDDWPAKADIDAIVSKSSGQFIYAATVMRFIQHSSASPALSLHTIRGMRPSVGNSPLANLHAVYAYIFSKAQDIQAVKTILSTYFIAEDHKMLYNRKPNFHYSLRLMGYRAIDVKSYFADLVAIVQVTTEPNIQLVFYHASLADYLQDKTQSGIYYVDVEEFAIELSLISLNTFDDRLSLNHAILILDNVPRASTELSNSLLEASTRQLKTEDMYWSPPLVTLVRAIERLYFETDRALFTQLLQNWIRFAYRNDLNLDLSEALKNTSLSLQRYYQWYYVTEGAKYTLGLSR